MKHSKYIFICLIFVFLLSLTACKKSKGEATTEEQATESQTVSALPEPVQQPELPKDEDGFVIANDYVKTVGETINVRTAPSTSANIYVLLAAGEVLNRKGYNDEWTKVKLDGNIFYIYSDYVIQTEPPEGVFPVEDETATDTDATELVKKIVIDPCNQGVINADQIPIGPNSEETKQGASVGNVGPAGTKESELNLTYAKLLKTELTSRGYEVVLTRDTDEINLTNKERAEFANASEAAVFVRIQMNYSENEALSGVMAVCMTEDSRFNKELYADSYKLCTRVLQGVLEKTACDNQGIYETDRMAGINWSEIPVVLIKLGYLSNADEEQRLLNVEYQQKLVEGIADGIDLYYGK